MTSAEEAGRIELRAEIVAACLGVTYLAGLGALAGAPASVALGGVAATLAVARFAAQKWSLREGAAEERLVRSLRKQRALEGVVVPLTGVTSQEGPCLAFDHVVHRCEACACTRPCSRAGGRYRAEDRGVGRFLLRNQHEALYVDGSDVRFESSFAERAGSHFHRLEAGAQVRVRGDFVSLEGAAPDDVRDLLAGLRELPRLLTPREGTSVLVETNAEHGAKLGGGHVGSR